MFLKFHESWVNVIYFVFHLELQWRVFLEMVNYKLLQAIDFRKWFQLGKHVAWNSTTNFDDTISFDILKPILGLLRLRACPPRDLEDFARKVPNRVWTNVEKTGVLKDPERPLDARFFQVSTLWIDKIHCIEQFMCFNCTPLNWNRRHAPASLCAEIDLQVVISMVRPLTWSSKGWKATVVDLRMMPVSPALIVAKESITVAKMASIPTFVARNILQLVRPCHIEFAREREHYCNAWNIFFEWRNVEGLDMFRHNLLLVMSWLRLCHVSAASWSLGLHLFTVHTFGRVSKLASPRRHPWFNNSEFEFEFQLENTRKNNSFEFCHKIVNGGTLVQSWALHGRFASFFSRLDLWMFIWDVGFIQSDVILTSVSWCFIHDIYLYSILW